MYQIKLTARARKELKAIKKRYQEGIKLVIDEITENPFVGKLLLREFFGKYIYKIGPFRIIYVINKRDKIVIILTAGHRERIYNY